MHKGNGYPRCESSTAKANLCFQVANICEGVNPVGGEDGLRSFSHQLTIIGMGRLHTCFGHVVRIKLMDLNLIRDV